MYKPSTSNILELFFHLHAAMHASQSARTYRHSWFDYTSKQDCAIPDDIA